MSRPREPRGGPCEMCPRKVPADSPFSIYCSYTCQTKGSLKRRGLLAAERPRGDGSRNPFATSHVARLIAAVDGMGRAWAAATGGAS